MDKATIMLTERLNTDVLQIPGSMEAPGMRMVLLPEYEGYPKTLVRIVMSWYGRVVTEDTGSSPTYNFVI